MLAARATSFKAMLPIESAAILFVIAVMTGSVAIYVGETFLCLQLLRPLLRLRFLLNLCLFRCDF